MIGHVDNYHCPTRVGLIRDTRRTILRRFLRAERESGIRAALAPSGLGEIDLHRRGALASFTICLLHVGTAKAEGSNGMYILAYSSSGSVGM